MFCSPCFPAVLPWAVFVRADMCLLVMSRGSGGSCLCPGAVLKCWAGGETVPKEIRNVQGFGFSASQLKKSKKTRKSAVFCYLVVQLLLICKDSHTFSRHFFPAQRPGGFVPKIHLFVYRIGLIPVLTHLPAQKLEGFGGFLWNSWISPVQD